MKITLRGKKFNPNKMNVSRLVRLITCIRHEISKYDPISAKVQMAEMVILILNTKLKNKLSNMDVLLISEY
jgi:hypothetical protein